MPKPITPNIRTATREQRDRVDALVARVGESRAADLLTLSRNTLGRLMAGATVRRASLVAVDIWLEKLGDISSLPPKQIGGRQRRRQADKEGCAA